MKEKNSFSVIGGNHLIKLVNQDNIPYEDNTLENFIESYFPSDMSTGYKQIEENKWFLPSPILTKEEQKEGKFNNKIIGVSKFHYKDIVYILKSNNGFQSFISKNENITVKNLLSRKILQVPVKLLPKWQDLYNIATAYYSKINWNTFSIKTLEMEGFIYTLYFGEPWKHFILNNIIVK